MTADMSREYCNIAVPRSELVCPICRDLIRDVYCTPCGHSFCYTCIMTNLEHRPLCPCCSHFVTKDKLHHNKLLAKLIHNAEAVDHVQAGSTLDKLKHSITSNSHNLTCEDIQELEKQLQKTKAMMEFEDLEVQMQMLQRFLSHTREEKVGKLEDLTHLLDSLKMDIGSLEKQQQHIQALKQQQAHSNGGCVEEVRRCTAMPGGESTSSSSVGTVGQSWGTSGMPHQAAHHQQQLHKQQQQQQQQQQSEAVAGSGSATSAASQSVSTSQVLGKKQLASSQFNELAECYMRLRRSDNSSGGAEVSSAVSAAALMGQPAGGQRGSALEEFARTLSVCTYQNKLEVRAEIQMQTGMLSTMEFNMDGTVLATAGVSKCIKIMDAEAVKRGDVASAMSDPDIVTRAKLSSLSWNKFIKHHLISSDFEGVLTLWDVNTKQIVQDYEAHEKRIWSVDFCPCDPCLAVSGSDDGKVKVWSTKQHAAAFQLDIRVNVCSVCYSKTSAYTVAVGSADHMVRVYDLRRPMSPVNTFQGHSKAISYVDFITDKEVVSASTDSTLRMWDIGANSPVRTFTGHKNQRNFVGMSVHRDFIACGSETSEVYVYYKGLSRPIVVHPFAPRSPHEFMSTVCWQPKSSTLFAVSSSGVMKALELTGC